MLREPLLVDWPAGTTGAAISVYDETVLVEITDGDANTLDTIQVPAPRLSIKRT